MKLFIIISILIILLCIIRKEHFNTDYSIDNIFSDIASKGDQGPIGITGITGLKGLRGNKGLDGDQGARGYTGSKGTKGKKGNKGPNGVPGKIITKPNGRKGATGPNGYNGTIGPEGPKGYDGYKGLDGPVSTQDIKMCESNKCLDNNLMARIIHKYGSKLELAKEERQLTKANLIDIIDISKNYRLSFDIKVLGKVGGWGSIVEFTTLHPHGHYRTWDIRNGPRIMCHPNSTRLHVIVANVSNPGEEICGNDIELPIERWGNIKLEVKGNTKNGIGLVQTAKLWYNNTVYCQKDLTGYCEDAPNIRVYSGSPWWSPANARIKNLVYERLF